MRVAHITDIHVEVPPSPAECLNKRLLGEVNLHVLGRSAHFSRMSQEGLVRRVVDQAPDLVICTGDLTAVATDAEFAGAVRLLEPITSRFPFFVIAGNHDVYTDESVGRMGRYFGETFLPRKYPAVVRHGGIDMIAIDTSVPDWLSRGDVGGDQLEGLDACLASSDAPAWILLHYPVRGRHGEPYGPATRACRHADRIEAVIARHPRVKAVLHGHEHHGYRTKVAHADALNPGAGGYAWLPERGRTAHFCVYEVEGGAITGVDRWRWDGSSFEPEPGGAFASGG
jgi:3',5'-cyclic AMP phosphodiesterase CpdA